MNLKQALIMELCIALAASANGKIKNIEESLTQIRGDLEALRLREPGSGKSAASSLHRIEESYAIKDFESRGLTVVAKSDLLRRPADTRDQISYKGPALGKTDRFVLVLRKTAH